MNFSTKNPELKKNVWGGGGGGGAYGARVSDFLIRI